MKLLKPSLAFVRERDADADAWIADPTQLVFAVIGLVAVPVVAFAFGPLGRYIADHTWLLALVVPAMLLFALAHTHVHIDRDSVVIRHRWLWFAWGRKQLQRGGIFDEPIQDS